MLLFQIFLCSMLLFGVFMLLASGCFHLLHAWKPHRLSLKMEDTLSGNLIRCLLKGRTPRLEILPVKMENMLHGVSLVAKRGILREPCKTVFHCLKFFGSIEGLALYYTHTICK